MAEPNVYNLLMGSEPDAQETAASLAAQIRRQRGSALAGSLADRRDPHQAYTALQEGYAKQDAGLLERAAEQRMRYGEEAKSRAFQEKLALAQMAHQAALQKSLLGAGDDYKLDAAANEKIRIALDPNGPRAGNFGNYAKRYALLGDVKRQLEVARNNPTESQMYELARTFDSAVSMGAATVSGTQHLIPKSAMGSLQNLQNYFANTYRGARRDEWVRMMNEQVDSQANYWKQLLDKEVESRLGSLGPHFERFPDSTALTLEKLGVDASALPYHPAHPAHPRHKGAKAGVPAGNQPPPLLRAPSGASPAAPAVPGKSSAPRRIKVDADGNPL